MNESLIPSARLYAVRHQLELAESPGSGKDGIVLIAKRKGKPADSAIKDLRCPEAYEREKRAYERLRNAAVSAVLGLNVPQLLACDDELRVTAITTVNQQSVLAVAG